MRYIAVILLLSGCAVQAATNTTPPTGEQVFNALLMNSNIDLQTEPLCKANQKLYAQLALSLSVSYDKGNTTTIKSSCIPSKFELQSKHVIKVWDCTVQLNETNKQGEFISSSTYAFSLTPDKKRYVKGSLRCY